MSLVADAWSHLPTRWNAGTEDARGRTDDHAWSVYWIHPRQSRASIRRVPDRFSRKSRRVELDRVPARRGPNRALRWTSSGSEGSLVRVDPLSAARIASASLADCPNGGPMSRRWPRSRPLGDPVTFGCRWLHDVGYSPDVRVTGFHALDGAVYLRDLGLPPEVVSLVAYHTGAEFEAEERGSRWSSPDRSATAGPVGCADLVRPDRLADRVARLGE